MTPVAEQWGEALRTHLTLGETRSPVRAAAAFSAEAGFFAVAGRGDEDGRPYFRSVTGGPDDGGPDHGGPDGGGPDHGGPDGGGPDDGGPDDVEALSTVCEETVHPRGLRIAGVLWRRESREAVSDAVTGSELELALLRDGDRAMWVVRAERDVCVFVLVDGEGGANVSEARSLTLDFASFLAGQGY
ncbi:hypothetical protein [Streptomyces sp. DH8]|uniref:hypothetical protein n=1 Tax=Streptomyces sp. DH8 TaxID=2857008 RepID=UPI001E511FF6|nr:hypothetical protein [Streptomyces sp. DH8]